MDTKVLAQMALTQMNQVITRGQSKAVCGLVLPSETVGDVVGLLNSTVSSECFSVNDHGRIEYSGCELKIPEILNTIKSGSIKPQGNKLEDILNRIKTCDLPQAARAA